MFEKNSSRTAVNTTETVLQDAVLVNAMANANGSVKNVATVETVNVRPLPDSITTKVSSGADAEGATKIISLFNEDFLNTTPTNNGNDAGQGSTGTNGAAITVVYGDGRSGKAYNRLAENANGGEGLLIKKITCIAKKNNLPDEGFFTSCKMKVVTDTGIDAATIPYQIPWQKAISNTPNKDGIYSLEVNFRLNYISQLQYLQDANTEVSLVLEVDTDK